MGMVEALGGPIAVQWLAALIVSALWIIVICQLFKK